MLRPVVCTEPTCSWELLRENSYCSSFFPPEVFKGNATSDDSIDFIASRSAHVKHVGGFMTLGQCQSRVEDDSGCGTLMFHSNANCSCIVAGGTCVVRSYRELKMGVRYVTQDFTNVNSARVLLLDCEQLAERKHISLPSWSSSAQSNNKCA